MEENVNIFELAKQFKSKYPSTIAWRLKKNSMIVQKHLNPGEQVKYVFVAQKNENPLDVTSSCVIALTNERILIGRDRIVFGYFLDSITPNMFNDLKIRGGILWGTIIIDTINELVYLTNVSKRALSEIETKVSSYMMEQKRKYRTEENNQSYH